jgi:hypothetical protein
LTFNPRNHHFARIIDLCFNLLRRQTRRRNILFRGFLTLLLDRDNVRDEILLGGCAEFGGGESHAGVTETGTFRGGCFFGLIDGIGRFETRFF